eukprot:CAMPEP_0183353208 /NCGR_PEP_ID=MMETSP0164_2-20130417/33126_1 /TAXON_ID=221442 /ORGANISM="Coccolithus pelagicus ssp braarudi, Strain PLY182g" /LENGTH=219 /DNA_ID=CAMNT_0025525855 /DNA_START=77 /DNA_END=733 /DNA_ORIENTATION=-
MWDFPHIYRHGYALKHCLAVVPLLLTHAWYTTSAAWTSLPSFRQTSMAQSAFLEVALLAAIFSGESRTLALRSYSHPADPPSLLTLTLIPKLHLALRRLGLTALLPRDTQAKELLFQEEEVKRRLVELRAREWDLQLAPDLASPDGSGLDAELGSHELQKVSELELPADAYGAEARLIRAGKATDDIDCAAAWQLSNGIHWPVIPLAWLAHTMHCAPPP